MGHVSVYLCDFCSRGDTPSRPVIAQQHDREPRFVFVCGECITRLHNALHEALDKGTTQGLMTKAQGWTGGVVPSREGPAASPPLGPIAEGLLREAQVPSPPPGYPPVVNPPPFTDPRAEGLVQSPPPPAAPKPEQGPPILKERSQENIQFPYRT